MKKENLRIIGILFVTIFALIIVSCGTKAIKEESVLDTPDYHFSRGMTEFDNGNLSAAMVEFDRAKALNPDYGLAFSGMALVYAKQGDFKKAHDLANKGILFIYFIVLKLPYFLKNYSTCL